MRGFVAMKGLIVTRRFTTTMTGSCREEASLARPFVTDRRLIIKSHTFLCSFWYSS